MTGMAVQGNLYTLTTFTVTAVSANSRYTKPLMISTSSDHSESLKLLPEEHNQSSYRVGRGQYKVTKGRSDDVGVAVLYLFKFYHTDHWV